MIRTPLLACIIFMKGGGYRIQSTFGSTELFVLISVIISIWFYKLRGIINCGNKDNPGHILGPRKCIGRFLKLRTRFMNLHFSIDNSSHLSKRRIRVKKLTLDV